MGPALLAGYVASSRLRGSGDANKLWFIPTELGDALRGLGNAFGTLPASDLADAPKKPAAEAPKSAPQAPGSYGING